MAFVLLLSVLLFVTVSSAAAPLATNNNTVNINDDNTSKLEPLAPQNANNIAAALDSSLPTSINTSSIAFMGNETKSVLPSNGNSSSTNNNTIFVESDDNGPLPDNGSLPAEVARTTNNFSAGGESENGTMTSMSPQQMSLNGSVNGNATTFMQQQNETISSSLPPPVVRNSSLISPMENGTMSYPPPTMNGNSSSGKENATMHVTMNGTNSYASSENSIVNGTSSMLNGTQTSRNNNNFSNELMDGTVFGTENATASTFSIDDKNTTSVENSVENGTMYNQQIMTNGTMVNGTLTPSNPSMNGENFAGNGTGVENGTMSLLAPMNANDTIAEGNVTISLPSINGNSNSLENGTMANVSMTNGTTTENDGTMTSMYPLPVDTNNNNSANANKSSTTTNGGTVFAPVLDGNICSSLPAVDNSTQMISMTSEVPPSIDGNSTNDESDNSDALSTVNGIGVFNRTVLMDEVAGSNGDFGMNTTSDDG